MPRKRKQNRKKSKKGKKENHKSQQNEAEIVVQSDCMIVEEASFYKPYELRPLDPSITVVPYPGDEILDEMMTMCDRNLSEPYSIFTYRFGGLGLMKVIIN